MAAGEAQSGQVDAQNDAQLADIHRELLADDSIQFDLPVFKLPEPPEWARPFGEFLDWLAPFMIYLFWGAVIIGGLIIAFLVFLEVKGIAWRFPWQKAKAGETEAEKEWRPDTVAAQILIAEADALAARGEYDEAVHLLLRRSVADIGTRLPDFLRPSLTARDIAADPAVPQRARGLFGQMARIVESGLFARRPVGAQEWREARAAYERFAFSEAWQ